MARTRSRKRRSGATRRTQAEGAGRAAKPGEQTVEPNERTARLSERTAKQTKQAGSAPAKRTAAKPRARTTHSSPTAPAYGERPHAPWHPLPLSELLIVVGAVLVVLGLKQLGNEAHPDISHGGAKLLVGLVVVAIGTFEVALREHRSGYRSHTIMLSLLPVLVFDSVVVLVVSLFTTFPRLLNLALLAVDLALFVALFRMLRARFLEARHARVIREG
jgi:hypothetical protein